MSITTDGPVYCTSSNQTFIFCSSYSLGRLSIQLLPRVGFIRPFFVYITIIGVTLLGRYTRPACNQVDFIFFS